MAAPRVVLLVDDDPDVVQVMVEALRDLDYAVYAAADGEEALARLSGLPRPCIILLDMLMRPMGGVEFLQALQSRPDADDFKVIVLSADGRAARQLPGAAAALGKPFEMDQLEDLLETLLPPSRPA